MRAERFGRWTVLIPETRRERARGLLGRDELDPWTALVLRRCRSIHTIGMRFPIDVVVLDAQTRPIRIVPVPPRRFVASLRGEHLVEVARGRGGAFSAALGGSTTPALPGIGRRRRTAAR